MSSSEAASRLQAEWATHCADMAFVGLSLLVSIATLGFPAVSGYGTHLHQLIVLSAWSLLAHVTSQPYADTHHGFLWSIALLLNVITFWSVAVPLWVLNRKRRPFVGVTALMVFAGFYIASLYWLFPATDGP